MATRGRKPKPDFAKSSMGNPGKRPLNGQGLNYAQPWNADTQPVRTAALRPPKQLTKSQQALWQRFVNPAHWLSDFDTAKAYVWTCLQDEYQEDPRAMNSARITQLRVLGTELGLDPGARVRIGADYAPIEDPTDRFFDF